MARHKFVTLPEPARPVPVEFASNDPWLRAADRRNWRDRACGFDDLLVESLAVAVAGEHDVKGATGLSLMVLTAACEAVCDPEIRGPDAAVFYLLTVHAEWRAAAREFFLKNKIDPAEAIKLRPGVRLVHEIALARSVLATEKAVLQ